MELIKCEDPFRRIIQCNDLTCLVEWEEVHVPKEFGSLHVGVIAFNDNHDMNIDLLRT